MGAAINAAETVTFFAASRRICCGAQALRPPRARRRHRHRSAVLDEIRPQTFENVPQSWQKSFPVPDIDGHKYARPAVVLSGELASTGRHGWRRGGARAGAAQWPPRDRWP
jgi:hypothetical protein